MTTAYAILLAPYVIGYFITFGIVLGSDDDDLDVRLLLTAFLVSFLSWIGVGLYISDRHPSKQKAKP